MSELAIQTVGVSKSYARGKLSVSALSGVDLEIRKGETIAIVGPSGSGKTSLLNLIGGLDTPTGGKVIVDGTDLGGLDDDQLAQYRLQKVGFIFQFYNLMSTLTAIENVEVPMTLAKVPKKERHDRAVELLRAVGLQLRENHTPDEMSGGEQQRVAVARALSNNPSILLGDEPTGDLDSKSAKSLMDLLRSLRKDKQMTLVFVTHDPVVVARCDRAYAVRDGKITQQLSRRDIEDAKLSEKYDSNMLEGVY
ncbi:MAG: ABC transporter ATP-binding protein [Nitrososphaerales archaeon]